MPRPPWPGRGRSRYSSWVRKLALPLALVGALCGAGGVLAQDLGELLIGREPKPVIDQDGFFSIVLPSGFDCEVSPRRAECKSNRGVEAVLQVRVHDVPPSASVDLVMLNALDTYKKKPHFRLLHKKKQRLDGTPAIVARMAYDHHGNVEYPVGVQVLYMVRKTKAYEIHYEGRLDQFPVHDADLRQAYATFKAARLDAGGNPIIEDLEPKKGKKSGLPGDVDRALKVGY
jgi:hypothetical protein